MQNGRVNRDDLTKLRIERGAPAGAVPKPRRRWRALFIATIVAAVAGAFAWSRFAAPVAVETVTVAAIVSEMQAAFDARG